MEKIIAGRHLDVENSIKELIYNELSKIEGEYHKLTSARVILDVQKNLHFAEVILHGKKISIEAKAKSKDLKTSITSAIQKAKKQLKKYLDKVQNHHHRQDRRVIEQID